MRACHLCALALLKAGEAEEALEVLDDGAELVAAAKEDLASAKTEEEAIKMRQVIRQLLVFLAFSSRKLQFKPQYISHTLKMTHASLNNLYCNELSWAVT